MVKWYNESLPRISRGFDYPWPHIYEKPQTSVWGFSYIAGVIERAFELDCEGAKQSIQKVYCGCKAANNPELIPHETYTSISLDTNLSKYNGDYPSFPFHVKPSTIFRTLITAPHSPL